MDELIKISDVIKICKSLYASYGATAFFVPIPVVDFENLLRTSAVDVDKYVPQWISVKDKMPKCGELVLIYIANLNAGKGDYALDKCRKVDGKKDWEFYNKGNADFDVTHWMPLSKPPKESEVK